MTGLPYDTYVLLQSGSTDAGLIPYAHGQLRTTNSNRSRPLKVDSNPPSQAVGNSGSDRSTLPPSIRYHWGRSEDRFKSDVVSRSINTKMEILSWMIFAECMSQPDEHPSQSATCILAKKVQHPGTLQKVRWVQHAW